MSKYEIFNVNCSHCVNKIKNELDNVSFSDDLKTITTDCEEEELREILEDLGFKLGKKLD